MLSNDPLQVVPDLDTDDSETEDASDSGANAAAADDEPALSEFERRLAEARRQADLDDDVVHKPAIKQRKPTRPWTFTRQEDDAHALSSPEAIRYIHLLGH